MQEIHLLGSIMAKRFNIFLVVFLIFALLFSAVGSELLRRYDLTSVKTNGFKAHTTSESEIRSSLSEKVNEYNKANDRIETDSLVISETRYQTEQEAVRKAEEARRQEELRVQQEILRAKEEERERERLRHEALLREQEEARLREEERQAEIARQEALLKAQEEAAIAEEERQAELARMEVLLQEQEQARLEEEQRQAEIARQEELVRQKEVEEQLEKERHDALLRQQEEERQVELLRQEEEQRQAEEAKLLKEQEEAEFRRQQEEMARVEEQVTLEQQQREEAALQKEQPTIGDVVESEALSEESSTPTTEVTLNREEALHEETEATTTTPEMIERIEESATEIPSQESDALTEENIPHQTETVVDEGIAEQIPSTSESTASTEVQQGSDIPTVTPEQDSTRAISLSDKVSEAHLMNALDSIDSASEIAPYTQDGKDLSTLTNDDMAFSYSALKSSVRDAYSKLTGDVTKVIDTAIRNAVNIRAEFISLSSLMWYVTVEDSVPLIRYAFNDDAWTEVENTNNGVFAIPYTIDRDEIKLSVELFMNDTWSTPYTKVITKSEIDKARGKTNNMLRSFENVLTNLGKDIDIVQLPSSEI